MDNFGEKIIKADFRKGRRTTPEEIELLKNDTKVYLKDYVYYLPQKIDEWIKKIETIGSLELSREIIEFARFVNPIFTQLFKFHEKLSGCERENYLIKKLENILEVDVTRMFLDPLLTKEEIINNLIEFKNIVRDEKLDELN